MLQKTLAEYDAKYSRPDSIYIRAIFVTHIVPPEQGWPIAMYCPICKETTFVLSPWAIKPKDGDYWRMNNTCANEEFQFQHNMNWLNPPRGYDLTIEQYITIEEAKRRYPNTPIPAQDNE